MSRHGNRFGVGDPVPIRSASVRPKSTSHQRAPESIVDEGKSVGKVASEAVQSDSFDDLREGTSAMAEGRKEEALTVST